MQPEDYWKNDRREESVMFDELMDAVETIKAVAESEELSFDQVANVYHAQSINRIAEILVDIEDQTKSLQEDLQDFVSKEIKWLYDNQPLQIAMTDL